MGQLEKNSNYLEILLNLLNETDIHKRSTLDHWQKLEADFGDRFYADILYHLTRKEFKSREAKTHWQNILRHRDKLSDILGREAGLRTAVCDYFLSLKRVLEAPVIVESHVLVKSEESAVLDELTGLYNRRFFNRELRKETERSRRSNQPFSLLMIDVDYFKNFNDRFGHLAGDAALRQLADILLRTARVVDQTSRYGGEEFVLILPHADREEAFLAAERHRRAVKEHVFTDGRESLGPLTVSIGVATCPGDAKDERGLISKADQAMYLSKSRGRDCVSTCSEDLRQHRRFPLRVPAECRFPADKSRPFTNLTVNLSLGGMLCESKSPIEVGVQGEAVLSDPNSGEALPLKARSVRLLEDKKENGVYYIGMSFESGSVAKDSLKSLFLERAGTMH